MRHQGCRHSYSSEPLPGLLLRTRRQYCRKAQKEPGSPRGTVVSPQLATYSWRLPTKATTAVVPTRAALSALPNSSSVRLNASVRALSNFSELKGSPSSALVDSASSMAEVRKASLSLSSLSLSPGCTGAARSSERSHCCQSICSSTRQTLPCFREGLGTYSMLCKVALLTGC